MIVPPLTEEQKDALRIEVDAQTLANIREIAREAVLFHDTLGVLNSYLKDKHGCVIASVQRDGISGVVWSTQNTTKGKILFKDLSFVNCLRFALAQEVSSD